MNTAAHVIRDNADLMVVTTQFDVDHEYDAERMTFADITANVQVTHGGDAIKLNFSVFGEPDDGLTKAYEEEISAIDSLIGLLSATKMHITHEFNAVISG